ncbi:MAG TPA: hypothetical protein VGR73_09880 [Bryobacteraceae bacterium]|nr:hypothetical protein [Bryobacteraceae bacterium]
MLQKVATMFCCAALFSVVPAGADQFNKKTVVTFTRPVELPGVVLPAGTYVFRLYDSFADRHIVQVFDTKETHIYATILAIPNWRIKPTSENVMRFTEPIRGNPEALRAWFYPADSFGQEFVYPKKRAAELAVTSKAPVLTGEVTPAEKPEELVKEPVAAITPENKEVELAQVSEPPPLISQARPAPQPPAATPANELPKTASPLPLLILVGFGSLGIAAALRAISRRVA